MSDDYYVRLYGFGKKMPHDLNAEIPVVPDLEFSFSNYFTQRKINRRLAAPVPKTIRLSAMLKLIKSQINALPRSEVSHYDLNREDLIEGIEVVIEDNVAHIHTYIPSNAFDFLSSRIVNRN